MSNVFYKKLQKNGKIVLSARDNREISSLKPAGCRKVIRYLDSWSRWFQLIQSMKIGIAFSFDNKSILNWNIWKNVLYIPDRPKMVLRKGFNVLSL